MFDSLDPKIRKRLERRYAELQIDPIAFIRRFDLNNDGILDDNEKQAALSTLAHELLHEEQVSNSVNDTELSPGMTLRKRYLIVSEIGNGAQGIAYAARDLTNQKIVVVKQLRLSHMDAWDAYDSFRREAEVLSRLSHPCLPRFIAAFTLERNGKHFYFSVQSLMKGVNLDNRLENGEFFSEDNLVSIARQSLDILHYLHLNRPSVLHRDVKPSNLLLDDDGRISLVDFGAVQYTKATKTLAVGTSGYMATEQLCGAAKPQSDLYSLGATLIRLATRRHPHDLPLKQMRMVWRNHASLSKGFCDWIDKLVDPEIEDRFKNAKSAKAFLDSKKSVFVRKETKNDLRLSLKLTECVEGKPAGSNVRIWESVDQFVCTFPRNDNSVFNMKGGFTDIINTLFYTKHYHSLSKRGGGFSFDSKGVCIVSAGSTLLGKDTQLLQKKLTTVENTVFDDLDLGLLGVYKKTHSSEEKAEVRVALIVGLDNPQLDWVWKRLARFLASHQHFIM